MRKGTMIMTRNSFLAVVFAALFTVGLFAADPVTIVPAEPAEEMVSETMEWLDILRFGIDTEVIDLLRRLTEGKDERLKEDIRKIFSTTRNPQVREASLTYFLALEYRPALDAVLLLLEDHENQTPAVLLKALQFLTAMKAEGLAGLAIALAEHENKPVASSAIRAVGASGSQNDAAALLSYLADEDYDHDLKGELILALGELHAPGAVDKLLEILEDTDAEPTWRRYACIALGKIGDRRALPPLMNAFDSGDTMLRSYAISGIASFDEESVGPFLIDGLRDSFWRVRVAAIQGLAERKATEAVPALIYKAKNDPEVNVRNEALTALSKIGTTDSMGYLTNVLKDTRAGSSYRETALKLLAEQHLESALDEIGAALKDEWTKKDSRLLELAGRYLSAGTSSRLEDYFARFLDHPSFLMKIHGIRGIERNRLDSFGDKLAELSKEPNHPSVRKAALAALENM